MQVGRPNSVKLRIAETCVGTRALGPGLRSVAWVQGCPFHCQGCIAPEWIPREPAREVDPADLAAELLSHPGVCGFTFSGGEPMSQAAGLAQVISVARQQRDLTLICFTGYRLAELRARPPGPGVTDLLAQTDVLIDGRYVAAYNDGRGLRGSTNQRIHFLTGRVHAREAMVPALALIEQGRLHPELVTSQVVRWDDAAEALAELPRKTVFTREAISAPG